MQVADPASITAIVNVGDDVELHGLHISPDLDTVLYTLSGLANPATGWGIAGDTFATLEMDVVLRTLLRELEFRTTYAPGERWHNRGVAFAPAKSANTWRGRIMPWTPTNGSDQAGVTSAKWIVTV